MAQQSGFEEGFQLESAASLDVICMEVYPKAPGAVEGYIFDTVKATVRDFFRHTKCWRRAIGPFTAAAEVPTLGVNPVDARTRVIQILEVTRNGVPLPRALANARSKTNIGPSRWYVDPFDVINWAPPPAADLEDIYVSVVLTPRLLDDNFIPQWVLDQHREALLAGTLERLYQEPNKAYSNMKLAEHWGQRYRSLRALAIAAGNANFGTAQPWCYPTHTR